MNGKSLTELSNSEGCKKTNNRTDNVEDERGGAPRWNLAWKSQGKGTRGRTVQVK